MYFRWQLPTFILVHISLSFMNLLILHQKLWDISTIIAYGFQ